MVGLIEAFVFLLEILAPSDPLLTLKGGMGCKFEDDLDVGF